MAIILLIIETWLFIGIGTITFIRIRLFKKSERELREHLNCLEQDLIEQRHTLKKRQDSICAVYKIDLNRIHIKEIKDLFLSNKHAPLDANMSDILKNPEDYPSFILKYTLAKFELSLKAQRMWNRSSKTLLIALSRTKYPEYLTDLILLKDNK